MEITLYILAAIFALIGFAGAIIPGLPGAPLNLIAIGMVHYAKPVYSNTTLIIAVALTAIVLVADFFIPIYFAKKFGATKQGIWGSIIGMIVGIIFTPIGMMLGILLGAIIGDLISGKNPLDAAKSGAGNFIGTVVALLFKVVIGTWMLALVYYQLIKLVINKI